MSLGIAIKGTEGIVVAAESRVTLTGQLPNGQRLDCNFDNATKLISFSPPNTSIGVVTYGLAAIQFRTVQSYVPEFESTLTQDRLTVADFAQRLSDFLMAQWNAANIPQDYRGQNITLVVTGFNENEAYGRVYKIDIPSNPAPLEHHPINEFGITWGGQREVVDRLIQGYDTRLRAILDHHVTDQGIRDNIVNDLGQLNMPIPIQFLPLQDCVDLAIFFIKTTIDAQNLSTMSRGCGGYIDVATITRHEGLKFVQRKKINGEQK